MSNSAEDVIKNQTISFIKQRDAIEIYSKQGYTNIVQKVDGEDILIIIPNDDLQLLINALFKVKNALL